MGKVTHDDLIQMSNMRRKGKSIRHIAAEVGHSTRTVQKYLKLGLTPECFKKHRRSRLAPYQCEIEQILGEDNGKQSHNLTTARGEIMKRHPNLCIQKSAFNRFVHDKCIETRIARIPLEHDGTEAQIDFFAAKYKRRGRIVHGHAFSMAFPKSGVSFMQLFPAENQQCLLEAMRNCFEFIGCVPRRIVFDNASSAVLSFAGRSKIRKPTAEYANFAAHYGFECIFCNPRSGWEKGNVERTNAILRRRHFTGCPEIGDECAFNRSILPQCQKDAQREAHYLKHIPKWDLFKQDINHFLPLPKSAFDCRKTTIRKTDKCALFSLCSSRYSTSDKHARKNVVVKYGAFEVDIFDEFGQFICRHKRSYKEGSTTIDKSKYRDALAARPRARIKESDNEYTSDFWNDFKRNVSSVRPAAQDDACIEFCESHGLEVKHVPNRRALILLNLDAYESPKVDYDKQLQSNNRVVQKA